jgi:hypothetical protein
MYVNQFAAMRAEARAMSPTSRRRRSRAPMRRQPRATVTTSATMTQDHTIR